MASVSPPDGDVCAHCRETVFAARFGLWDEPVEMTQDGEDRVRWTGGYTFTTSMDEWERCEESDCPWSRRFFGLGLLPEFKRSGSRREVMHVRVGTSRPLAASGMAAEMTVVINDSAVEESLLFAHEDDPAAAWIEGRTRNPYIGRPNVLATAKAYIEDCVQIHERCKGLVDRTPLPTRLIDCSDPLCPRIIETKNIGTCDPYIALSYVWGEDQPHRTTRQNLPSYMESMDIALLPQTIRDAIRVTHTLGVRYLWIDSLCIIQDSREDKHRELARMRDVYLHALLTIDAGNATRVSQGFLHDGEPLSGSGIPLICPPRSEGESVQVGVFYILRHGPEHYDPDPDICPFQDQHRLSDYGNTGKRAWCLQEALMSRRHLLFTEQALQFRCRSATRNIGGFSDDADPYLNQWTVTSSMPDVVFRPTPSLSPGSEEWVAIHKAWHNVVEEYVARSLTYPSDTLVACAGLAEVFGRALGSDYLAGLWRDSLLHDLLWFNRPNRAGPKAAGRTYRAPSWSWAAIESTASSLADGFSYGGAFSSDGGSVPEELVDVIECAVTLEDPNLPFGAVTDGFLVLRATLLGPYERWIDRFGRTVPVPMDDSDSSEDAHSSWHTRRPDMEQLGRIFRTFLDLHYGDDEVVENLWLLPLVLQDQGDGYPRVQCLVVVAGERDARASTALESHTKVYRRVGYCSIQRSEYTTKLLDPLRKGADGQWGGTRTEIKLV
ncbi:heterokaryon incompatibility protein-domain-containing protein [Cubamyces lactineus]|nr:heterokaryon incompatibility protein-domain-containing protein [Cubamyces lactineus]